MFKKLNPTHKRVLLDVLGWLFLAVGFLGLLLPFLQGILFLAIGAYLLSLHSPWFHEKLVRLKGRFPRIVGPLERFDTFVRRQFGLELEGNGV
ncbi:MAG TPA: PGPGW domain-containing protein [Candidatus Paceibacterota bacterium]|nr:PGPGW domain-containing protein [Candidatus Paceibacterota bacterium]